MSNYLNICNICTTENELYRFNCKKCGNVLHNKVANIDFAKTVFNLLDSPTQTFKEIIYSETKNLSIFFFLIGLIKIFYVRNLSKNLFAIYSMDNVSVEAVKILFPYIVLSAIIKIYLSRQKIVVRIKDLTALYSYTFLPIILFSIIIVPVQYGIFGNLWFTFIPSPLSLKPNIAYFFLFIETLMLIIYSFYFYLFLKIFFSKKNISIILTIIFILSQILI